VAGFAEAVVAVVPALDVRVVGLVTLVVLGLITTYSADLTLRTQYVVMAFILVSLISFFMGQPPDPSVMPRPEAVPASLGFWPVLAVFSRR